MLTWDEEVKPSLQTNLRDASAADLPAMRNVLASVQRSSDAGAQTLATASAFVASSAQKAVVPQRMRAADKRIINGQTDVNQLVPFKYKWAWEK